MSVLSRNLESGGATERSGEERRGGGRLLAVSLIGGVPERLRVDGGLDIVDVVCRRTNSSLHILNLGEMMSSQCGVH